MSEYFSMMRDDKYNKLVAYAHEIIEHKMTSLPKKYVDLIYAETDVDNFTDLRFLANYISQYCGRVVVLTAHDEDMHLIISKSGNVSHLYVNEIVENIAKTYGGKTYGDETFAGLTSHWHDVAPEMIDMAIESVIVAIPSPMS